MSRPDADQSGALGLPRRRGRATPAVVQAIREGYHVDRLTSPELVEHVRERFGVELSEVYVWKIANGERRASVPNGPRLEEWLTRRRERHLRLEAAARAAGAAGQP